MTPRRGEESQWETVPTGLGAAGSEEDKDGAKPCGAEQRRRLPPRVYKFVDEMRWNRPGPNSKIGEFWNLNLIFLKNIKKYVKN
jgi:hypothetical protein